MLTCFIQIIEKNIRGLFQVGLFLCKTVVLQHFHRLFVENVVYPSFSGMVYHPRKMYSIQSGKWWNLYIERLSSNWAILPVKALHCNDFGGFSLKMWYTLPFAGMGVLIPAKTQTSNSPRVGVSFLQAMYTLWHAQKPSASIKVSKWCLSSFYRSNELS